MPRPRAKAPKRRYHISGQSVVTVNGRDFYLGQHDSPESIARYAVLIGVYQSNGFDLPGDFDLDDIEATALAMIQVGENPAANQSGVPVLVKHVTAVYRELAKTKYARNPQTRNRVKNICKALDDHYGNTKAENFGPLKLQEQRQRWVDEKKARTYVNFLTSCLVRIWKHAVSQELVSESSWHRLKSVEPLREGETTAPESEGVQPVDLDIVRATAELLSPTIKAMIRIQVQTGMRPSELCRMRPIDIDRSCKDWMYRPPNHKNKKRKKTKAVPIVGDARDALTDYLNRDPFAYCFQPSESYAWYLAMRSANRKTPHSPGRNKPGSNRVDNPAWKPGKQFTSGGYSQAIKRAAKRAGVEHWYPYQIRHHSGTAVRDALGVEAAQALLGHSKAAMTEHYAKQTEAKAIAAAKVAPKL